MKNSQPKTNVAINQEIAPTYVPTNYIIKTDKFDLCTIKKPIKILTCMLILMFSMSLSAKTKDSLIADETYLTITKEYYKVETFNETIKSIIETKYKSNIYRIVAYRNRYNVWVYNYYFKLDKYNLVL